jgi:hypothetical protein
VNLLALVDIPALGQYALLALALMLGINDAWTFRKRPRGG